MVKDKSKETFEKRLERLRGIVDALERGDQPLEENESQHRRGPAGAETAGDFIDRLRVG